MRKSKDKQKDRSGDEYQTPPEIMEQLWKEYTFDLDPCCRAETAQAPTFYTMADNGLSKSWANNVVFMNPPYSRTGEWIAKAYRESLNNGATVVCLVNASTASGWYHDYVLPDSRKNIPHKKRRTFNASEVIFIRGRVCFLFGGERIGSARAHSMIVVFRPDHIGPPLFKNMVVDEGRVDRVRRRKGPEIL